MKPAAAGLLLGLAALGRPNLLLAVVVIAGWLFWKARSGAWTRTVGILVLVGFAVGVAPATLYNLGHGEPVLISANLGANLVAGNSDSADGVSAIPVGVRWDDLQLRTQQAGAITPGAASRFLTREALGWMAAHPGRTLQLVGKKVLLFLGGAEPRNNINPRWLAENDGVFLLARWWPGTWLVLPVALVGLAFARGSRRGEAALLRWYLLAQFLGVLPFFVNARFRAPLLPVLALFAAAAIWELAARVADRKRLMAPVALLVVALVAANVDWLGLGQDRWLARDYFNLGLIHARSYDGRAPRPALAEENFREAVRLMPEDPDFQERLAAHILGRVPDLMAEASRLDSTGDVPGTLRVFAQAEAALEEAMKGHRAATDALPRSFRSWTNLGTGLIWRGDILAYRATLAGRQGDSAVQRRQAVRALASYQRALQALNRSLEINPRQADVEQQARVVLQSVMRLPTVADEIINAQKQIQAGRPTP